MNKIGIQLPLIQVKLYSIPEKKSNKFNVKSAQIYAKQLEQKFERISNKEYQSWLNR
jgi:hypothetical protein